MDRCIRADPIPMANWASGPWISRASTYLDPSSSNDTRTTSMRTTAIQPIPIPIPPPPIPPTSMAILANLSSTLPTSSPDPWPTTPSSYPPTAPSTRWDTTAPDNWASETRSIAMPRWWWRVRTGSWVRTRWPSGRRALSKNERSFPAGTITFFSWDGRSGFWDVGRRTAEAAVPAGTMEMGMAVAFSSLRAMVMTMAWMTRSPRVPWHRPLPWHRRRRSCHRRHPACRRRRAHLPCRPLCRPCRGCRR
mmetsp:Transcript_27770/g.58365  ORF Transcript_27770/g.58365 Transcript_27770/m.58365 type:complete len:249 (+) Transcript_27770:1351-2097(+)